jgi:subtilisin family serine protease
MQEYIITVSDPKVWDEIWDTMTTGGLGDNYIPSRSIKVANERPFNDYCAHFYLTATEAAQLSQDPRLASVELQADLQPGVIKVLPEVKTALYDKGNTSTASMKNWGLLRCSTNANPFSASTAVTGDFNYNLDGTGVDIVIVDSGIEANHPEFAVNADGSGGSRVVDFNWASLGVSGTASSASIGGYLGDSDGHGTNCASIAAGNTCGWASGAAVYSIRIYSGTNITTGSSLGAINSDLAFDLVKAFHLAKVAAGNTRPTVCSNSWGYVSSYDGMQFTNYRGTQYNNTTPSTTYGQVNPTHPVRINYLDISAANCAAAGVILVGAAGNYKHKCDISGGLDYNNYYRNSIGGNTYYHRGMSPTAADGMITVGAIDNTLTEQKGTYSETGPRVDLYAPGSMIMGAYANKSYVTAAVADARNSSYYLNKISGTSQATPQVTGVIACLLQARPTLTGTQVKTFLTSNSLSALTITGSEDYTNGRHLLGGSNRVLFTPFNSALRGRMTSSAS